MEHDVPAQIAATGRLQDVVRAVLGEPSAVLGTWEVELRSGGLRGLPGDSWLYLLQGTAHVGTALHPWRVVLKGLAPKVGQEDPSHIFYWKRETLLYGSGLLDSLAGGLRAPRCYGCDELANGTVWLWLEHVQEDGERAWSSDRWTLAARHLGQFNGAYLTGRPLPAVAWLGGRRLRTWLERHGPLVERISAASLAPRVRQWWPRPVVDDILRLWNERDVFCSALEQLPQTFGHGDAIRRNLIGRRDSRGNEETVAIDWEYAGLYAAGEDVGQTLSVASAFYDVEPADLPALDEALYGGYLEGLRDAGWRGNEKQLRFAYVAHAALRNIFNAVGTTVPDDARRPEIKQNYGHTWEELAERRAAIRPFLLDRASEARALMDKL